MDADHLRHELCEVRGYAFREREVLSRLVDRASDARQAPDLTHRSAGDRAFLAAGGLYHAMVVVPLLEAAATNNSFARLTKGDPEERRQRWELIRSPQPSLIQ
jgi:hypothetical protein